MLHGVIIVAEGALRSSEPKGVCTAELYVVFPFTGHRPVDLKLYPLLVILPATHLIVEYYLQNLVGFLPK